MGRPHMDGRSYWEIPFNITYKSGFVNAFRPMKEEQTPRSEGGHHASRDRAAGPSAPIHSLELTEPVASV